MAPESDSPRRSSASLFIAPRGSEHYYEGIEFDYMSIDFASYPELAWVQECELYRWANSWWVERLSHFTQAEREETTCVVIQTDATGRSRVPGALLRTLCKMTPRDERAIDALLHSRDL